MTNPLKTLQEYGQSVWLDFLSRDLFRSGELKRLIAEDGLRGMTSNPSIFEKAIGHGEDYDAQIAELEASGDLDPGTLFERLAVTDIQSAADALRPVYDQTQGRDGYVSIEVSPYLAMQTDATIEEARRLWREIGRDNLRVKIPATKPGLPAIRTMIAEGVNINITLLFSQKVYAEVAEAYISGLEEYVAKGGDPHKVASVASFFVSRIDTMVDEALDKKIAAANDPAEKARLRGLQGKIAIANAKLAYQLYQHIFRDERWQRLAQHGAQTQRLLWASTGTKNKAYSDVLYVEELIGPDTVNTMPPATMEAFRDHGRPRMSLEEDVPAAEAAMSALAKAGISIDQITARLVEDGVRLFAEAADNLYAAVQKKRRTVLGGKLNAMTYKLPQDLNEALKSALEDWRKEGKARRLWDGDAALWTNTDEAQWLGWLTVAEAQLKDPGHLEAFADEVKRPGFGARKIGAEREIPHGVSRRADDRRTLLGVVRLRHGAGRGERHRGTAVPRTDRRDGALLRRERSTGREPGDRAWRDTWLGGAPRPRQADRDRLAGDCLARRLARTAAGGIDRQARPRHHPGGWRAGRRPGGVRQRPAVRLSAPRRRSGWRARAGRCRAGSGRTPGRAHHRFGQDAARPGILPLGDGDRGSRLGPRHQPVRPARCRSTKGQDARIDRRL